MIDSNRHKVECEYCSKDTWGGVLRIKHHIAGINKDVRACSQVTDKVKKLFTKLLDSKDKKKRLLNLKQGLDEEATVETRTSHLFAPKKRTVLKQLQ